MWTAFHFKAFISTIVNAIKEVVKGDTVYAHTCVTLTWS